MVSVELLDGDRGRITPKQIAGAIKPDDIHYPRTRLVALENTVNKGGGAYYNLSQIASIHETCKNHQLKMHLDGARLFNALTETGEDSALYGRYFDTISICLSKGLGAPVGSLLLMRCELLTRARRIRKVLGGAMRQSGYLAAAGIYALDNHIARLKEDHRRASEIAAILTKCSYVSGIEPADTNIVIFRLYDDDAVKTYLARLRQIGILALPFGASSIRMVTHMGIDDNMVGYMAENLPGIK